MSTVATAAMRGPLSSPLSQWLLVGLGAMYIADPETLKTFLRRTVLLLLEPKSSLAPASSTNASPQQPIVIHTGGAANSSPFIAGGVWKMVTFSVVGAGVCWGSYSLLVSVLPESWNGVLPVTHSVFQKAVSSLAKGVLSVQNSLAEQFNLLSGKQDVLEEKQDETLEQVRAVDTKVLQVSDDLAQLGQSLDMVQATLSESERRTTYIARGVRLLTRGVGSILPHEADLSEQLFEYERDGRQFEQQQSARAEENNKSTMMVVPPRGVVVPSRSLSSSDVADAKPLPVATALRRMSSHGPQQADLQEIKEMLAGMQQSYAAATISVS